MNKITKFFAALCVFTLCGCSTMLLPSKEGYETASTSESTGGSSEQSGKTDAGTILGTILGSLGVSTSNDIMGTWIYQEPSVQFTSDNLLAKAGGVKASAEAAKQLEPYYEKVGIKPGKMSITFNEDKTMNYVIGAKKYAGTYEYDNKNGRVKIQGTVFAFPEAYVTIVGNQLSLTFDSTKLLNLVQNSRSLASTNKNLAGISEIADSFDGMKTGFLLVK